MPKIKTHKSSSKRFKLNKAKTLLKHRRSCRSHINSKVSGTHTLRLRKNKQVTGTLFSKIKSYIS